MRGLQPPERRSRPRSPPTLRRPRLSAPRRRRHRPHAPRSRAAGLAASKPRGGLRGPPSPRALPAPRRPCKSRAAPLLPRPRAEPRLPPGAAGARRSTPRPAAPSAPAAQRSLSARKQEPGIQPTPGGRQPGQPLLTGQTGAAEGRFQPLRRGHIRLSRHVLRARLTPLAWRQRGREQVLRARPAPPLSPQPSATALPPRTRCRHEVRETRSSGPAAGGGTGGRTRGRRTLSERAMRQVAKP